MRDRLLFLLVLLVVLVALAGGGAVVAVNVAGRRAIFDAVRAEVRRQLEELRPDLTDAARDAAARIIAAQAVVEQGAGGLAWREGWNFGNVRRGSWKGPVVYGRDKKPDGRGGYVPETGVAFRKYDSLAAAVADFFTLLSWARYRPARDALFAGDAALYAKRLRDDDPATAVIEGGYYTAPLAEYQAGLAAALKLA